MNFTPLTTLEQWDRLLSESQSKPIVILKHSNACGTSRYAYDLLLETAEAGLLEEPVHLVVVQTARDVSDRIAEDIKVRHQSPQVLVIRDKKRRYDASHFSIQPQKLIDVLNLI